MSIPPFSYRNSGHHTNIDDFPQTARTGLLHLLWDLADKRYVEGWPSIAREARRIARQELSEYNDSVFQISRAKEDTATAIQSMSSEKVFDFCECLYGRLAVAVTYEDFETSRIVTALGEAQRYIATELQRLFDEDDLAYQFTEGCVRRRGRRHTEERAVHAGLVLGDSRLTGAREHYNKALKFFRNPTEPDYPNCVKEAVCALEAAGKALFADVGADTLGELIKNFFGKKNRFPPALLKTYEGMYGYRNSGEAVSHAGATGGVATKAVAEYVLSVCASQIIFLYDLADDRDESRSDNPACENPLGAS